MNPVRSLVSEECMNDTVAFLEDPTIAASGDLVSAAFDFFSDEESDFCVFDATETSDGALTSIDVGCDFGSVPSEFEDA
eukprot:11168337-Ditylum_brightwellii.AAC.1